MRSVAMIVSLLVRIDVDPVRRSRDADRAASSPAHAMRCARRHASMIARDDHAGARVARMNEARVSCRVRLSAIASKPRKQGVSATFCARRHAARCQAREGLVRLRQVRGWREKSESGTIVRQVDGRRF
jgi:hypothetical protein